MRHARIIMGMPVTIDIVETAPPEIFEKIFDYFTWVDETFSPFKPTSEVSRINDGSLLLSEASREVQEVYALCEKTVEETSGYFNINSYNENGGIIKSDPSGIVKGWSIYNAATLLHHAGYHNFFIDAGGDIQTAGENHEKKPWLVGIKDPFNTKSLSKIVTLANDRGIATSGTYEKGLHIYNPLTGEKIKDIVSLTVIGPNVYECDKFATAAFAMGDKAIDFIESLDGFEGYLIDANNEKKETSGFAQYIVE